MGKTSGKIQLVIFSLVLFTGCSGYEVSNPETSSQAQDFIQRQDSRPDYQSKEQLNRMEELATQLKKMSSFTNDAIVTYESLYIQALLFSTTANASSCEELLQMNPHMPTGRYSLKKDGRYTSWNCEVVGGVIVSSSPAVQPRTAGLCIFEGNCVRPQNSLISDPFESEIQGTSGNNNLTGTPGRDKILAGGGADKVTAGAGNDVVEGNNGNDELFGNEGEDLLVGGPGHDKLYGGNDDDLLRGGIGNDRLSGGSGHDFLEGGEGSDFITGEIGNDYLRGGPNRDILAGGPGSDRLEGQDGNDDLHGGAETDHLYGGDGADLLYGNSGHDRLAGNKGPDRIHGGSGNDVMFGNESGDMMDGGPGDDYMEGNDGDDVLHGGEGKDTLIGHQGADVYVFTPGFGIDTIVEFEGGKDRIDIRTLGINNMKALKSRITCYGKWTGNTATSNDYCVIAFSSNDMIAILQSPGISSVLSKDSNLDKIFVYRLSQEEEKDRAFLMEVYNKYFGRDPQVEAYYYWLEMLKNSNNDLEIERDILFGASEADQDYVLENTVDVALKFLQDNNFSIPDWLAKETVNVETLINQIYQKYFERDVDDAGKTYWMNQAKDMTDKHLEAAIINGSSGSDREKLASYHIDEARAFLKAHGFPLKNWITEAKEQHRKDWVAQWYPKYYGRSADDDGLTYWNGQLTTKPWEQAERDFIYSSIQADRQRLTADEDRVKAALALLHEHNYSVPSWLAPAYTGADKTRFINDIYKKYFNRDADQAGIDYHIQALTNPSKEKQVEANIINGATGKDLERMAGYHATTARNFLTANGYAVKKVLTASAWDARSDYVKQQYDKYFKRQPDGEGLKYWNGQMATKEWGRAVADMIVNAQSSDRKTLTDSENRVNRAKKTLDKFNYKHPSWLTYKPPAPAYTNADKTVFINGIYKKYFNRDADQEGINYHIKALTEKAKENQVEANIINGATGKDLERMAGYHHTEARNFLEANGFAVKKILTADHWNSRSDYVKQQFDKYFKRQPKSDSLKYWNGQMATKEWGRAVADMIVNAQSSDRKTLTDSENRVNRAKKTLDKFNYKHPSWLKYDPPGPSYTDADKAYYINSVFQKYFNKNADSSGLNYYKNQLTDKSKEVQVQINILNGANSKDRETLRTKNVGKALSWVHKNGQTLPSYLLDYRTINSMYRRYFGKDGDQDGLNYWVGEYHKRGKKYKTVERDIIYNCQGAERSALVNNSQRKGDAHKFLTKHGYNIPSWLK